jgi:hypothetical protein
MKWRLQGRDREAEASRHKDFSLAIADHGPAEAAHGDCQ